MGVKKKKERVKKTLMKKPKERMVKKRKMERARRKRKETTKFSCLLSPNLVISYYIYQIRHLIIISALQKKGANRDRLRQFEKYPNPNARNARPIPYYPQNDRTSVDKTKKKYPKRWCFLSNKTKKNPFFPHLKQKTDKNKNFPYKSNEKNSLHYSVFVSLS